MLDARYTDARAQARVSIFEFFLPPLVGPKTVFPDSMYVRIKRERLTLFFTVDASTTVDEVKARLFESLAFVDRERGEEDDTKNGKPVVGQVVCDTGVRITSAGDIGLALCRYLPADSRESGDAGTDRQEQEADMPVETRTLAGNATIADSKVENDDILCIVLPGENADAVFRKTAAGE